MYKIGEHTMEVFFSVSEFVANVNGRAQLFTEVTDLWLDDEKLKEMDELESVDTLVLFNMKYYNKIKHKIENDWN